MVRPAPTRDNQAKLAAELLRYAGAEDIRAQLLARAKGGPQDG